MAAPAPGSLIEITAGGAGALGGGTVGVDWVAKDGKSARISIGGVAAGKRWSTRLGVHTASLVAVAGGAFTVNAIVPGRDGQRGQVIFTDAVAGQKAALPADALRFTTEDPLLLGGPEVEQASSVRITALRTDGADVEWWPALHAREDADPGSIHTAHLTPGGEAVIGGVHVSVLAIEGGSPGSIVLRLLPG